MRTYPGERKKAWSLAEKHTAHITDEKQRASAANLVFESELARLINATKTNEDRRKSGLRKARSAHKYAGELGPAPSRSCTIDKLRSYGI
jgi:hypothetical protein